MLRHLTIPVLLLLATPACGGKVVVDGNPTDSTSTGAGGSSGTGGSGGTGPLLLCLETDDTLSVTVDDWKGNHYVCEAGATEFEFAAAVVDNDGQGHLVLDSCSPGADCIPLISKVAITAAGLVLDVPKGTYVQVRIAFSPKLMGCGQQIQITNLPTWDGVPNPNMSGEQLWFLGVENTMPPFADTPVMATLDKLLDCVPSVPECGEPQEDDRWHFQIAGNPGDPGLFVRMGETAHWGASFAGGFQPLVARNLRSFSAVQCDPPTHLAYWIAHEYPLD